jgi:hypothetical protein
MARNGCNLCFLLLLLLGELCRAQQSTCVRLRKLHYDVHTVQDAEELAAAAACADVSLQATWHTNVVLRSTITVAKGTSLTVTAAAGASASVDGAGTVQLFTVLGGNLTVIDLALKNGYGDANGAAINGLDSSHVIIQNCELTGHSTIQFGAAVACQNGTLTIERSRFTNNEGECRCLLCCWSPSSTRSVA